MQDALRACGELSGILIDLLPLVPRAHLTELGAPCPSWAAIDLHLRLLALMARGSQAPTDLVEQLVARVEGVRALLHSRCGLAPPVRPGSEKAVQWAAQGAVAA